VSCDEYDHTMKRASAESVDRVVTYRASVCDISLKTGIKFSVNKMPGINVEESGLARSLGKRYTSYR